MITSLRDNFNNNFSEDKYNRLLSDLDSVKKGSLDFRVAETPLFINKNFTQKMLGACEDIIDIIVAPDFKKITERSIPKEFYVPGESEKPECMVFDFGVCTNESGEPEPQLIEMQGFPSLFAYQLMQDEIVRDYAQIPVGYDAYFNGYDKNSYVELLRELIMGDEDPENVVLLEIYPEQQKTRIDFYYTEKFLGLKILCVTKLFAEGKDLFYKDGDKKVQVKRIYNRVIFDDLSQQKDLPELIDFKKDYNVTWVPHPNWFYRISKFTLPFIDSPYVPETFFLNEVKGPVQLDQYVLKPLFSFAGMGVVIDVQQSDIDKIEDPENWILQRKVQYSDVIKTMDVNAKAEIRLFYFWKKDWQRPKAVHNLARLSKGKMIGTRYNKDKTWVGGTIAYFEK